MKAILCNEQRGGLHYILIFTLILILVLITLWMIVLKLRSPAGKGFVKMAPPIEVVWAMYESSLAELPGQDTYWEPTELPAEAARLRLFSYLLETFQALTESEPVLLILDDLQWADRSSLELLHYLCRHLSAMSLLIIGIYRDVGLAQAHPLVELGHPFL